MNTNTVVQIENTLWKLAAGITLGVAVIASLSGCEAQKAEAVREKMVAASQRDHLPEVDYADSLALFNSKFFLWPDEGMNSDVVRDALNIGKRIDELDTDGFTLTRELETLSAKIAPIKDAEKALKKIRDALRTLPTQIAQEEQRNPSGSARLTTLRNQLAARQAELPAAEALVASLTAEIDPDSAIRNRLETELPAEQEAVRIAGEEQVAAITSKVYWYKTQPEQITLKFVDGKPQVQIKNWALYKEGEPQEDGRSFSSNTELFDEDGDGDLDDTGVAGTVTNVSYTIKGGVWRFDVGVFVAQPEAKTAVEAGNPSLARARAVREAKQGAWVSELREVYSFRFGRIRYDKTAEDGRIFFGGEMNRYRDPNGQFCTGFERDVLKCYRQGSAKLVDRNN